MAGAPLAGGGLSMTGSQVQLTAVGLRSVLVGQISSLQGTAVRRARAQPHRDLADAARQSEHR